LLRSALFDFLIKLVEDSNLDLAEMNLDLAGRIDLVSVSENQKPNRNNFGFGKPNRNKFGFGSVMKIREFGKPNFKKFGFGKPKPNR